MKKINKRVYYSYLDDNKGTQTGHIDIDMNPEDDYLPNVTIQKYVKRQWENSGYKTGFIDTVVFENIQ